MMRANRKGKHFDTVKSEPRTTLPSRGKKERREIENSRQIKEEDVDSDVPSIQRRSNRLRNIVKRTTLPTAATAAVKEESPDPRKRKRDRYVYDLGESVEGGDEGEEHVTTSRKKKKVKMTVNLDGLSTTVIDRDLKIIPEFQLDDIKLLTSLKDIPQAKSYDEWPNFMYGDRIFSRSVIPGQTQSTLVSLSNNSDIVREKIISRRGQGDPILSQLKPPCLNEQMLCIKGQKNYVPSLPGKPFVFLSTWAIKKLEQKYNQSDLNVFVQRGTNRWEYCGIYQLVSRGVISSEERSINFENKPLLKKVIDDGHKRAAIRKREKPDKKWMEEDGESLQYAICVCVGFDQALLEYCRAYKSAIKNL